LRGSWPIFPPADNQRLTAGPLNIISVMHPPFLGCQGAVPPSLFSLKTDPFCAFKSSKSATWQSFFRCL